MRNFFHVSQAKSIVSINFGDDQFRLAKVGSFSERELALNVAKTQHLALITRKCEERLFAAFGGTCSSSSEEEVRVNMGSFLARCLAASDSYYPHGEVFVYVNCNTGASLTLVPVMQHDYEGFAIPENWTHL